MAKKVHCPHCKALISLQPELYGKNVVCPKCGKKFQALTKTDRAVERHQAEIHQEEKEKAQTKDKIQREENRRRTERWEKEQKATSQLKVIPENCPNCGGDRIEHVRTREESLKTIENNTGCLIVILLVILIFLIISSWEHEETRGATVITVIAGVIGFVAWLLFATFNKSAKNLYVCVRCGYEFEA